MTDELDCLPCPDCGTKCQVTVSFLSVHGDVVEMASCARCGDDATIRRRRRIGRADYEDARRRGFPVLAYDPSK